MLVHFRLQAEVRALAAILEPAVTLKQPPYDWLEALKLARKQREYRNVSEQFEPQIAQLEQAPEAKEAAGNLDDFLSSIPPAEFLN